MKNISSLNGILNSVFKSVKSLFHSYRVNARKSSEEEFLIFDIEKSFFNKIDYR